MAAPQQDVDQWISDAREAGLPVFTAGMLILVVVLDIPVMIAGVMVLLPMFMAQLAAAKRMFFPAEPDWPHG